MENWSDLTSLPKWWGARGTTRAQLEGRTVIMMRHRGGLDQSCGGRDGRSGQTVDVFWKFYGTAVDTWHGGAVRATEAVPANRGRARGLQGIRLSPDPGVGALKLSPPVRDGAQCQVQEVCVPPGTELRARVVWRRGPPSRSLDGASQQNTHEQEKDLHICLILFNMCM